MTQHHESTIRCQALLTFRSFRFGRIYEVPDTEDTWVLIAKGLLRELDPDTSAGTGDWLDGVD